MLGSGLCTRFHHTIRYPYKHDKHQPTLYCNITGLLNKSVIHRGVFESPNPTCYRASFSVYLSVYDNCVFGPGAYRERLKMWIKISCPFISSLPTKEPAKRYENNGSLLIYIIFIIWYTQVFMALFVRLPFIKCPPWDIFTYRRLFETPDPYYQSIHYVKVILPRNNIMIHSVHLPTQYITQSISTTYQWPNICENNLQLTHSLFCLKTHAAVSKVVAQSF